MLEFNNLKNSLKSGGSWVVAIDDLALELDGGKAGGGGLGVPIGAVIRRRMERLDALGSFV